MTVDHYYIDMVKVADYKYVAIHTVVQWVFIAAIGYVVVGIITPNSFDTALLITHTCTEFFAYLSCSQNKNIFK